MIAKINQTPIRIFFLRYAAVSLMQHFIATRRKKMSDSDIILAEEKCYQWLTDKTNNDVPADEEFELIKASM